MNRTPSHSVLDFMRRNARLIAGVALFVMLWMLVYTFVVYKPSYAAKSTVIIKDSAITTRLVEPEQYYAAQTTSSSSSNPVLNTMGILKSGTISQALYAYFQQKRPEQLKKNHIKTAADWDRFFQDGSSFIKAKNQPGTDLIAIQFSWSNPVIAKEALAVTVTAFQNASRDLNKADQLSRTKFLERQVKDIEAQLADIRRQKSEYQSEKKTVSPSQEGGGLASSRLELSNKLNQIESQARGKENVARRYQQLLGMSYDKAMKASALGQNGTLTRLQDELYRLEQSYSQLNSSLTETNPKVLEVKAQIEQVRANIEAERARTMGRNSGGDAAGSVVADSTRGKMISDMLTAQAEAQDLRSQAAVVRNRLDEINRQISAFPSIAEGLANIDQKEASLSTALDHLRRKVLEGRLKEEQTLSNVFVVDAPRLPDKAQFPNRVHLIVLSVVLGLGAGLAVALAKEQILSPQETSLPAWMAPIEEQPPVQPAYEKPARTVSGVAPKAANGLEVTQPASFRQDLTRPLLPGQLNNRTLPTPAPAKQPAAPRNMASTTNVRALTTQPQAQNLPQAIPEVGQPHTKNQPLATQPRQPVHPERAARMLEAALSASRTLTDDTLLMPPETLPGSSPVARTLPTSRVRVAQPPALPPADSRHANRYQAEYKAPEVKRLRGLPAFLLEGSQTNQAYPPVEPGSQTDPAYLPNAERNPRLQADYLPPAEPSVQPQAGPEPLGPAPRPLPPKQLLTENDDLLADVVPMSPPADSAHLEGQRQEPEPAQFLANPEREPLGVSGFWFRKPQRAEAAFGLGPRGRQKDAQPGSLNRTMRTLDPNTPKAPATIH